VVSGNYSRAMFVFRKEMSSLTYISDGTCPWWVKEYWQYHAYDKKDEKAGMKVPDLLKMERQIQSQLYSNITNSGLAWLIFLTCKPIYKAQW
jgi:hypothetical protein